MSGTGEPPTAAEGMSDRGRSPRASGESVSSGASPLNSPLALERKKKKRPPPKFILDDPEYVVADAPAGERPAHARRPREPIVYAAPADAAPGGSTGREPNPSATQRNACISMARVA